MFVQRSPEGEIIAVSSIEQSGFQEYLSDDSPELSNFLSAEKAPSALLRQSDAELIRVIEDLISLLTEKGVFQYTELPTKVQEKLNARKKLRQEANNLDLLDDTQDDLPWP